MGRLTMSRTRSGHGSDRDPVPVSEPCPTLSADTQTGVSVPPLCVLKGHKGSGQAGEPGNHEIAMSESERSGQGGHDSGQGRGETRYHALPLWPWAEVVDTTRPWARRLVWLGDAA